MEPQEGDREHCFDVSKRANKHTVSMGVKIT
jgi:hypothetical protein